MRFDRAFRAIAFFAAFVLLSVAAGTVVGMHRGTSEAAGEQTGSGQSEPSRVTVNVSGDSGVSYVGAVGMGGDAQSASGTLGDEPNTYDLGRAGDTDTVRATVKKTGGDGKLSATISVDGTPAVSGESSAGSEESVDIQWFYQQPART